MRGRGEIGDSQHYAFADTGEVEKSPDCFDAIPKLGGDFAMVRWIIRQLHPAQLDPEVNRPL